MLIVGEEWIQYIEHRSGLAPMSRSPRHVERRALELNDPPPDYRATFGQRDILAFVGFIDLAGYSEKTHGKSPSAIESYLQPFLSRTISALRESHAMVDKTIGDEVMFVLPDIEEEGSYRVSWFYLAWLLGKLHDMTLELGSEYAFRFGIAYGRVRFFRVEGTGYHELTSVGETVAIAKRLASHDRLKDPQPVVGMIGQSTNAEVSGSSASQLNSVLNLVAGFASRFSHACIAEPLELKGVGPVLAALLKPKITTQARR